jgi:hypothetical protein
MSHCLFLMFREMLAKEKCRFCRIRALMTKIFLAAGRVPAADGDAGRADTGKLAWPGLGLI